jgi:hypothetical protein
VIHSLNLSEHPEFFSKPNTAYQEWKGKIFAFFSGFFSSPKKDASLSETKKEILLVNNFQQTENRAIRTRSS